MSFNNVIFHNYTCAKLFPFFDKTMHKLSDDLIIFINLDFCAVFTFLLN
jgi:hypothetical protein